jgi:hypothetical protein
MLKRSMIFFVVLSGCAHKDTPKELDVNWAYCEVIPEENWACLKKEDVKKLKEALVECRSRK